MDRLRKRLPSTGALFVFEAAARHLNFTRAAAELNVTQPAVSRALSGLEDYLQTKLFNRGKTGATLTEQGENLYRSVTEAFGIINSSLSEIEARRTGVEPVTLSISSAFATHWLMPRIDKFQLSFPSVDLRFQLNQGALGGPIGDVDLAMRFSEEASPITETWPVMPELLVPVCSPTYLEGMKQRVGEVDGSNCVILFEGSNNDWLKSFEDKLNLDNKTKHMRFPDYSVVIQTALLGQGIAPGWLNVSSYWLCSGELVPAAFPAFHRGRYCQLLQRHDKPIRNVVSEVRDWIVEGMNADLATLERMYPDLLPLSTNEDRKSSK